MARAAAWSGGGPRPGWRPERALARVDPEVAAAIAQERGRQGRQLSLLASESLPSRAVREAEDAALARRYAEGLPGARHSVGCQHLDALEELARRRATALFGAQHANVQPHSGTQAVLAAFLALCRPGETILALDPGCGGHLAHGGPLGAAASLYRFVHYGVHRDTGRIDLDEVLAMARRQRPALLVVGGSGYPRALDFAGFAEVAALVGAPLMVDMAQIAGPVAVGLHPSPCPFADVVVTTTHKTLRGPRGGAILCRAGLARAVDQAVYPGVQGGPLMQVIAAKAVAFAEAGRPDFAAYQGQVLRNAAALARALATLGFALVAGGTDTHLLIVDLRAHGLTGRQAERLLEEAGILCTRQPVPYDPHPPARASGIRLGTAVVTGRGMGEPEMGDLAAVIALVLRAAAAGREAAVAEAAGMVALLAERFPLPA